MNDLLQVYDSAEEADDARIFMKWLTHWRTAILCWALFSADLGHQVEDYLMNHSCVSPAVCVVYGTEIVSILGLFWC
jgi:exosortase/archaeosortase